MDRERIIVQRLIKALDDARSRYDEWADRLANPSLRDLLQRVARVHWRIADSLAAQMSGTGAVVLRDGSRMGPLRVFLAEKLAQLSVDRELACASHAVKDEAGIERGFREAIASVRSAELCHYLQMHRCEIEHASMEIRCLRTTMQLHMAVQPAWVIASARVRERPAALRAAIWNRHHLNA